MKSRSRWAWRNPVRAARTCSLALSACAFSTASWASAWAWAAVALATWAAAALALASAWSSEAWVPTEVVFSSRARR